MAGAEILRALWLLVEAVKSYEVFGSYCRRHVKYTRVSQERTGLTVSYQERLDANESGPRRKLSDTVYVWEGKTVDRLWPE